MTEQNTEEAKKALLDAVFELAGRAHRQTWWPFVGASMFPYIGDGDMLLVQHTQSPRTRGHIRLGDVIVFRRGNGLIAHRVVSIRRHGSKNVYRTKGDNTHSFDAPIRQASTLGRVIRIQKGGKLMDLERSHIKLLNLVLALSSYAIGVLHQAARLKSFLSK